MKKLLPLITLLFVLANVFSQTGSLLINENFTSLNIGDLNATNNLSSGWTTIDPSDFVQVANSNPLTYAGYTSGTKYVSLANISSPLHDDPYKAFIGSTTISANPSSFYISFVVNATTAAANDNSAVPILYLRNAVGANPCALYIGKNTTNLRFGISKDDGSSNATWSATNYVFGATYLVVVRYEFASGSNNDKMYVWINPSLSSSEPTTASALLSITSGTDATSPATSAITALQLRQSVNGAACSIDGIKAAYGSGSTAAANSAFAWTQLAPVGAPLPIKVYYFNAAKGAGFNALNWSAACSSTEATFEVQRSTDGRNFVTVNSITASQQRCLQPFNYVDNSSLTGAVFYRLKIIDIDGKVEYSSIVKINGQLTDMKLVGILPNPVSDAAQLNIVSAKKDKVELTVVSMEGKVVQRSSIQLQAGSSIISVDVANLQKGMYTIKGVFSDGQTSSLKFVKQ